MGRNTQILGEIISVLSLTPEHLAQLEEHFSARLILNVGDVHTITTHARHLRLRVEKEECGAVLDYIAANRMVSITVDVVEHAVNQLLGEDRFIEPE